MAARRKAARWRAFLGLCGLRARPEGALQQLQPLDDGRNALGARILEDGLRQPRCRSTNTHWGGGGGLEKLGGEQSTNLVILEAPANDKLVGLASVRVKHARI